MGWVGWMDGNLCIAKTPLFQSESTTLRFVPNFIQPILVDHIFTGLLCGRLFFGHHSHPVFLGLVHFDLKITSAQAKVWNPRRCSIHLKVLPKLCQIRSPETFHPLLSLLHPPLHFRLLFFQSLLHLFITLESPLIPCVLQLYFQMFSTSGTLSFNI